MLAAVIVLMPLVAIGAEPTVIVASKKFTESVILGEMATLLIRDGGTDAMHRRELGGTRVLWNALVNGDIHLYAEYTGTLRQEILAQEHIENHEQLCAAVESYGLRMSEPLGFNNGYALGMTKPAAKRLGVDRISDLKNHPELALGFSNEFLHRGDGWPSLRDRYGLPQRNVTGIDHDLCYRGLAGGSLDVMELYTTDAEIAYYDLQLLDDDLGHFNLYQAVWLYRADIAQKTPAAIQSVLRVEGRIAESQMTAMNARAKLEGVAEALVAADFLAQELATDAEVVHETTLTRLTNSTVEHLYLVCISMMAAMVLAVPLGVLSAKKPRVGQFILGTVGVLQTIPALALLVLLMTLLRPLSRYGISSIGATPAIAALFLYSLLPIVRNTFTGLRGISPHLTESAAAIGLPPFARLWHVELPLASPMILAGIKTAVVVNIGFATLGALIGAGGYGQPILTGIRLDNVGLILEGAIPAAGLALIAQGLFEIVERTLVPRGLRIRE